MKEKVMVYRVTGKILKPNFRTDFQKEIRALSEKHAVESIYKRFGSKHRAKRFQIKIISVEEIKDENVEDVNVRKMALEE